jgi:predicted ATPase
MVKESLNDDQISRLMISGYKSIAACDIRMQKLNVLIGANGAGKSNFIGFFRLIGRILDQQLQASVGSAGGPDAMLHFGRKKTEAINAELYFGFNGYKFSLTPTQDNRMMFAKESLWWNGHGDWRPASGHFESYVESQRSKTRIYAYVVPAMRSWRLYHFHDTSTSATVKQIHGINDNEYLREDARNLAAFLYRIKHNYETHYKRIIKLIQTVAPFFGDFHLRPSVNNSEVIQLEWTELGHYRMEHYGLFV